VTVFQTELHSASEKGLRLASGWGWLTGWRWDLVFPKGSLMALVMASVMVLSSVLPKVLRSVMASETVWYSEWHLALSSALLMV
jgi:hypothetical protein